MLLKEWSYTKVERIPTFDQIAFNKGILSLYDAMIEGRFYGRVAQATIEAYKAMNLQECLALSFTAQLFCAMIYAITQKGGEMDPLLFAAQSITSTEEESAEQEYAQERFHELLSDSFVSGRPFPESWADQGLERLRRVAEHNQRHPKALEYFIPVSYEPMPSVKELEKEFGRGSVSRIFDGRPFTKHPSCEGMDESSGIRIMCIKRFDVWTEPEEVIQAMARANRVERSYHPGTEKELLEFSRAYPDFQKGKVISSHGSFAEDDDDDRRVAVLNSEFEPRLLCDEEFDAWLRPRHESLFVRN